MACSYSSLNFTAVYHFIAWIYLDIVYCSREYCVFYVYFVMRSVACVLVYVSRFFSYISRNGIGWGWEVTGYVHVHSCKIMLNWWCIIVQSHQQSVIPFALYAFQYWQFSELLIFFLICVQKNGILSWFSFSFSWMIMRLKIFLCLSSIPTFISALCYIGLWYS